MSENKNKSDGTHSNIFTLDVDHSDSGEMPSIDQLLSSGNKNTGARRTDTPKAPPAQESGKPNVSFKGSSDKTTAISTIKSLKVFGLKLEIHFIKEESGYRYIQHTDHTVREFFGLDDLFQKMKIPQKFIDTCGTLGEFKKSEHPYLFEAFGINDLQFLQFVPNQNNKLISVYATNKSMLSQKEEIIAFVEHSNRNLSASSLDIDVA